MTAHPTDPDPAGAQHADADWTYTAEYYTSRGAEPQLRAVYRSRHLGSAAGGGFEDLIATKGGWRPTTSLRGIRLGRGEHRTVEVPAEEGLRLADGLRRHWRDTLRGSVEQVAGLLRAYGHGDRAGEIEALHAGLTETLDAEARLRDLVARTPCPAPPDHEAPRVAWNDAKGRLLALTELRQR